MMKMQFVRFHRPYFSFECQKADDKICVCKISNNVSSKPYHIEKSKTCGQIALDKAAHVEPPLFARSAISAYGG